MKHVDDGSGNQTHIGPEGWIKNTVLSVDDPRHGPRRIDHNFAIAATAATVDAPDLGIIIARRNRQKTLWRVRSLAAHALELYKKIVVSFRIAEAVVGSQAVGVSVATDNVLPVIGDLPGGRILTKKTPRNDVLAGDIQRGDPCTVINVAS